MTKDFLSLSNRLPIAVFAALLAGNVLLGTLLYSQLSKISETHQDTVGKSLAYQLAYSVKTPMLHRDALSLQVAASEIAKQPGVARVAILDQAEQLLTEKEENLPGLRELVPYRADIIIENAVAGFALIELDKSYYRQQGMSLFKLALSLLIFSSLLVLVICWRLHDSLIRRVAVLVEKLPHSEVDEFSGDVDELTALEQRILPWLTSLQAEQRQEPSGEKYSTFVSLSCSSLPQLKTQLSSGHFAEVLTDLDQLLARVLKLYSGDLMTFTDNAIVLQFQGGVQDDDHPVRAIYAVFALIKQLARWRSNRGLELDVSVALITCSIMAATHQLSAKMQFDECWQQLQKLQQMAGVGDVLLDKGTGTHVALDHIALLEPASSDLTVFRCEGLEATANTLVERQLAILGA